MQHDKLFKTNYETDYSKKNHEYLAFWPNQT